MGAIQGECLNFVHRGGSVSSAFGNHLAKVVSSQSGEVPSGLRQLQLARIAPVFSG
jgi:hypothetical protein